LTVNAGSAPSGSDSGNDSGIETAAIVTPEAFDPGEGEEAIAALVSIKGNTTITGSTVIGGSLTI
jgi:hypothetical protein